MEQLDREAFGDLIASEDFSKALEMADRAIAAASDSHPQNLAEIYFERGRLKWKLGDRAGATADYRHAIDLDASSPAAEALEMTRRIMDFYNRDLYNP